MEEPLAKNSCEAFDVASFERLMEKAWERAEKPVRLLGAGVRLIDLKSSGGAVQLDLFFLGRPDTDKSTNG